VLPIKYGSAFRPCPGYDLQVLDENQQSVPNGTMGQLVIKLPLPPGNLLTLFNNDQRFIDAYMKNIPGYYDTGDAGLIDSDGYVHVLARIDDVINVAGHRLSSGGMEEILSSHPDIAEAVVIGIHNELKGHLPLGMAVLNGDCQRPHAEIQQEVVKMVRERIGAVACFKRLIVVQKFPKTRSGKITRNVLRKIAEGLEYTVPATIEDPTVIDDMKEILKKEELELV
jgi:propionyl-CoA synthetase